MSTANAPGALEINEAQEETTSLLPNKKDGKQGGDTNNKNEAVIEDPFTRNLKLAFCFLGLQVSYVLWGVAQEQIMTQVYKPGKFTSSTVRLGHSK